MNTSGKYVQAVARAHKRLYAGLVGRIYKKGTLDLNYIIVEQQALQDAFEQLVRDVRRIVAKEEIQYIKLPGGLSITVANAIPILNAALAKAEGEDDAPIHP